MVEGDVQVASGRRTGCLWKTYSLIMRDVSVDFLFTLCTFLPLYTIQAHRAYEKGAEKWRREHIPKKGKGNISGEGRELLEDKELSLLGNETVLRGVIHDSRKRERSNEDVVFIPHQRGHPRLLQTCSSGRDSDESY